MLPENTPWIRWRRIYRRKLGQAMRSESCRVEGSRWNRPCGWEALCQTSLACVCNRRPIVVLRSRCCNRVACTFLKWCRAVPESTETAPPCRYRWWDSMQEWYASGNSRVDRLPSFLQ